MKKHDYSLIYSISISAKDGTVMGLIEKNEERESTKRVVNHEPESDLRRNPTK